MQRKRAAIRWPLISGYLGIILLLMACGAGGGTPVPVTPTATELALLLRLENGAVEAREENKGWTPVGGETTFEINGVLENTDPWMVNGNTFASRASTQVGEGLENGRHVRVRGLILEDSTWLATSIERAPEDVISPMIFLIGKVTSIDPWMVDGITLEVTSDTLISEGITIDMIVRVEILLLEDGTWEVIRIASLGNFTDVPGCASVIARVVSVNETDLQLAGWPLITIGVQVTIENDAGEPATLAPGQAILLVMCAARNEQVRITHIIILNPAVDELPADTGGDMQLICHKPDQRGGHTLSVAPPAVSAHLGHGDTLGACR